VPRDKIHNTVPWWSVCDAREEAGIAF
jgi:hypothetical protein